MQTKIPEPKLVPLDMQLCIGRNEKQIERKNWKAVVGNWEFNTLACGVPNLCLDDLVIDSDAASGELSIFTRPNGERTKWRLDSGEEARRLVAELCRQRRRPVAVSCESREEASGELGYPTK